jgi:hypothetical protein
MPVVHTLLAVCIFCGSSATAALLVIFRKGIGWLHVPLALLILPLLQCNASSMSSTAIIGPSVSSISSSVATYISVGTCVDTAAIAADTMSLSALHLTLL